MKEIYEMPDSGYGGTHSTPVPRDQERTKPEPGPGADQARQTNDPGQGAQDLATNSRNFAHIPTMLISL